MKLKILFGNTEESIWKMAQAHGLPMEKPPKGWKYVTSMPGMFPHGLVPWVGRRSEDIEVYGSYPPLSRVIADEWYLRGITLRPWSDLEGPATAP